MIEEADVAWQRGGSDGGDGTTVRGLWKKTTTVVVDTTHRNGKRVVLGTAAVAAAGAVAWYGYVTWWNVDEEAKQEEGSDSRPRNGTTSGSESTTTTRTENTTRVPKVLEDENVKQHFQSIQKISDQTTLPSILPQLRQQLLAQVDLDTLTDTLHKARNGQLDITHEKKLELWNQIKVLSFVRTLASVWAVCLLNLLLRVQLNILGRRLYLDTAIGEEQNVPGVPEPLTQLVQHQYLSHADYFPKRGIQILVAKMTQAVEGVIATVDLQHPTDMTELMEYISNVCAAFVESMRSEEWLEMLFPPPLPPEDSLNRPVGAEPLSSDVAMLDAMVSETRSILGSAEFSELMGPVAREAAGMVVAHLPHLYGGPDPQPLPFVKLVPAVAGITTLFFDHPKACTQSLTGLPQVQEFCVSVYAAVGPLSPPWPTSSGRSYE